MSSNLIWPSMDVAYIKRLQTNLDWFFRAYHIPHARIRVDGRLGSSTKQAIKDAKYYLGYLKPFIYWGGGTGPDFIARLHRPALVGGRAYKRGADRRRAAAHHDTNTVQGCAQWLLNSRNAQFIFVDDNGETARMILQELAAGKLAHVRATGGHTKVKLNLMQALVDMAKHGVIYINCLTNGNHTTGSHHYNGTAVDLDNLSPLGHTTIEAIAHRHGGLRNSESNHMHIDF